MTRTVGTGKCVLAALSVGLLGGLDSLQAQIQVSLTLDRNEYLLYEPIEVKVQITNQSGVPIDTTRMARNEPWLEFLITTPDNEEIGHTDREWSPPRLALLSGQTRTIAFNLTPYYQLRDTGRYRVAALAAQAGRHYSSRTINFAIINGAAIWKQNFMAPPAADDAKRNPRPRLYSLLVHRRHDRNMLYARIQNPEAGRVYCTVPVGDLVNYGEPHARIDKNGDFHIFHQSGTRLYTYTQFSINGKRLKVRMFSNISTNPTMVTDEDGTTEVVGGEEIFLDEKMRETVIPTPLLAEPPNE